MSCQTSEFPMLNQEVVRRMQAKYEPFRDLPPKGTKLLYEFSITPDEDGLSSDGHFMLVTPKEGEPCHYRILTELFIHYNLGMEEDFEENEVREWLNTYRMGTRALVTLPEVHRGFVTETHKDEIRRFVRTVKTQRNDNDLEEIFSEVLSN